MGVIASVNEFLTGNPTLCGCHILLCVGVIASVNEFLTGNPAVCGCYSRCERVPDWKPYYVWVL